MEFKSYLPFPKDSISQGFGGNANTLYASDGLKGHPAIDFVAPWGTPILNCVEDARVYSTLNRDNPDLSKYRAVCTMWDDPDSNVSYEVIYGHCSDIQAIVGTTPQVGSQIASEGNTGDVFTAGIEVSEMDKEHGSHAGAHLHFQVRKCLRVPLVDPKKHYIIDGNGILSRNGKYYEIVDFENGFNGCVDPMPFFHNVLAKDAQSILYYETNLISILKAVVGALFSKKKTT